MNEPAMDRSASTPSANQAARSGGRPDIAAIVLGASRVEAAGAFATGCPDVFADSGGGGTAVEAGGGAACEAPAAAGAWAAAGRGAVGANAAVVAAVAVGAAARAAICGCGAGASDRTAPPAAAGFAAVSDWDGTLRPARGAVCGFVVPS